MKVSIITVVFNDIEGIKSTIKSVISQEDCFCEYIVIDGGSQDGTVDIINEYNKFIDVIVSEPDKGIYDAMNKGILKSSGDWLLFLNSGDCFYNKDTLRTITPHLHETTDVVYGDTIYRYKGYDVYEKAKRMEMMANRLPFCHQSVFVKANIIKQHLFSASYRLAADYEMFYSFYNEKKVFKYIEIPVSVYNLVGGQTYKHPERYYKETSIINKTFGSLTYYRNYAFLKVRGVIPARLLSIIRIIKSKSNAKLIKT